MALFGKDSFQAVKKMTEPVYKTPKSVQQLIPISRIAENGVFELEKREEGNRLFDKAYIFHDINYVTKDEQQRQETMVQFCEMLNTLDIDYKFIIALHHRDIERVKEEI